MKRVGKSSRKYIYTLDKIVINEWFSLKISSDANQRLVKNAENFGQLLAQTLNEEVLETIKTKDNIGGCVTNTKI